jgi:hypothetical protein
MNQYEGARRNKSGGLPLKAALHLALAAAALVSLPAFATLGGNSSSVTTDSTALQATMTTTAKDGYTDYTLTLANGIIVHEFVNSANQVFEVTWNGKGMRPNMKQILGSYFPRFGVQEKERRPMSRHADRISRGFEFHSAVHNRWFSGTAHVPAMIPSSMSGPLAVPADGPPAAAVAVPNKVSQ